MQESKQNSNFEHPTCSRKNAVKLLCCSPDCIKSSLICNQDQCPCQNQHIDCLLIFYKKIASKVQFQKKEPPENVQKSYEQIQRIVDQMIDQLSFIKEDLAIAKQHFGKGMYQRKYIQKIQTGDLETINGKLVYNLEQQIATWKQPQIIQINRIKQFWQIKKKNFDSIIFFIKTLYSKQFTLFVNSNDESKITDRYDLLQQWLQRQRTKRVVQFELLFRASQHLFSAPTFHQKCNNIPNLLIIIKSLTGKVFGGFIPNAMMQSTSDVWISDETKTSFIFSLDSQECYPISQCAKSFCCNKTYGPTFGNVDFYICDKANISDSSYGNFPKSYGNQTTKTVLNITDLTGSLNNNNFRVSQYEVYKVVFS